MTPIPSDVNRIIHIGAGAGEELPWYLKSDAEHIILVEPNPSSAEALRKRSSNDARLQVLELAITDNPALEKLTEYNIPEADSVYRPTELQKLYPGLRAIAHHEVETKSPQWLLQQYPLKGDRNMLVIQAPGAEMALVQAILSNNQIDKVCTFDLTIPESSYHEGGFGAGDVIRLISDRGYNAEKIQNPNPDWQRYILTRDPKAQKIRALESELDSLTEQLQASEKKRQELQTQWSAAQDQVKSQGDQISHLQKKLSAAEKSAQGFSDLKSQIERLFDQSNHHLKQTTDALNVQLSAYLATPKTSVKLKDQGDSGANIIASWDGPDIKRAVKAWISGNWKSLAKLDNAGLPEKSDREYLAILAATGYQYLADYRAEERCTDLAQQWGATKQQIKTMMLSGVYNRLGRASVLSCDYPKAVEYFKQSLSTSIFSLELNKKTLTNRIQTQLSDMPKEDLDKTLSLL